MSISAILMAEENYAAFNASELIEKAKKSREISDIEKRLEEGHKILVGYLTSPNIGKEYIQKSKDVDISKIANELFEKFEEKAKEGKRLNYNEVTDFFKELGNKLAVPLGIGAEGTEFEKLNYRTVELYLDGLDRLKREDDPHKTLNEVRAAIANGHAEEAKVLIVNALKEYHTMHGQRMLLYEISPQDDIDFHEKAAEPLAKRINEEFKKAGIEKEVVKSDVARNITGAYLDRATTVLKYKEKYAVVEPK